MEVNRYANHVIELKNEIVSKIGEILGERSEFVFGAKPMVYYVQEGKTWNGCCKGIVFDGCLCADICTSHIDLLALETESLVSVLGELESMVRSMYEDELIGLLSNVGGRFEFGEEFLIDGFGESEDSDSRLLCILVNADGRVKFLVQWDGMDLGLLYDIKYPNIEDLQRIVEYLKLNVKRTFKVKVTCHVEKVFEVSASKPSEAMMVAKELVGKSFQVDDDAADNVAIKYEFVS